MNFNENHKEEESSTAETRFSTTARKQPLRDIRDTDAGQHQMIAMLSNLTQGMNSLFQVITNRLSYDKAKEDAFDRLYREMEDLKKDQELAQLRPLYIDLILLIDRMNTIYKDMLDTGLVSPELINVLKTLSAELVEILYRRGVEPIYSTSDTFDPKIQQVVEIIATQNPNEDGQIVEIVRHGFKYQEVVLRPEDVVIKKYQP